VKRPFSNLLAQTQSPLPSQTRTFNRLRVQDIDLHFDKTRFPEALWAVKHGRA
jgi:hypothetical protein